VDDAATSLGGVTRIGMIAGDGRLPHTIAKAIRARGIEIICAGIASEVDASLAAEVDVFRPLGLMKLGRYFRFFRRHDVRYLVWAGGIRKERILSLSSVLRLVPDFRGLRFIYSTLRHGNLQSQKLLGSIADTFEHEGFTIADSTHFSPDLLVAEGVLTKRHPSQRQLADIAFGWMVAKRMADLDVGQSVAVFERSTIAVEGVEGTDRNITRAGELCRGPFTVVKLAMQGHDMRFDVPTVGAQTIETMHSAGAAVLALEAGKTIMLDRAQVIEQANRYGLVIAAFQQPPAVG